jgi:hypothetical protein
VSGILPQNAAPVRLTARKASTSAAALIAVLTIAACSSSSSTTTSASASSLIGSATQQACTTITDILADGPDPDADPVGYAEAQVLPLRQLKISDTKLAGYVTALADAYQEYSSGATAGSAAAAAAVKKAENDVNTICPEAAS